MKPIVSEMIYSGSSSTSPVLPAQQEGHDQHPSPFLVVDLVVVFLQAEVVNDKVQGHGHREQDHLLQRPCFSLTELLAALTISSIRVVAVRYHVHLPFLKPMDSGHGDREGN